MPDRLSHPPRPPHPPWHDAVFLVALMATALALGAALAHAYELPNKIGLDREAYFTVQRIYAGWNRLGFVLLIQLLSLAATAVLWRREPPVLLPVLLAILGLLSAQAVFWIWTQPANVATDNWTRVPEGWEAVRRDWEYSHLAGAAFQLLATAGLGVAAIGRARRRL
ncbi:DUF1772 domain-containing protein [Prosthecomicrobium sp. N25]|uniref:DUF1772 domain-containing protein n=1 Tax=Prosthecomicrobium sp. N25 TaxID=3129254 RepID=UPI003076A6D5